MFYFRLLSNGVLLYHMCRVKTKWLGLMIVVLLAAVLRFWALGTVPRGFHRDEAFLGYNAYSILKTNRDINGNFLPLNFQSIVYAPGGYSYFAILPITVFGLNQFAIRFPAAFFGTLTVLVIYFLARELLTSRGSGLPLIASFFLAVSPWHLNLSRTATENVLVVFFLSLGMVFYLSWLKKKNWPKLLAAFVFFGINLYLYLAARSFLPLFLPILISISLLREKMAKKSWALVWILFFLVIVLPSVRFMLSSNLSLWIRSISLFSGRETQLIIDQHIREDGVSLVPIFFTRLFHNKATGYLAQFLRNYFSHFYFDFLFDDKGYPDRYRVPLTGLFYLFDLPLLLVGFLALLKEGIREKVIIFSWLLLSIVGSALTFYDVPNLQRTLIALPVFSLIAALGFLQIIAWAKEKKLFIPLLMIMTPLFFYNFFFYLHQYYVHFPLYRPWYRQDGYQELVAKVNEILPGYKKVVITDRESAPTIFFLFFGQYDPELFQKEIKNPTIKDFDRISFGKYEFLTEECPLRLITDEKGNSYVNGEENVLYVNSGLCEPSVKGTHQLAEIRRADNSLAFRILEYQK